MTIYKLDVGSPNWTIKLKDNGCLVSADVVCSFIRVTGRTQLVKGIIHHNESPTLRINDPLSLEMGAYLYLCK